MNLKSTYVAYTNNQDFQRNMVRKYIFRLIVRRLRQHHKQHFRIDVYIYRQYKLDYRRMDCLQNIDQ